MPAQKPSRLTLALPVVLFAVSLASLWLSGARGGLVGQVVAAAAGAGALGLVGHLIHTHSRSIHTGPRCDDPMG